MQSHVIRSSYPGRGRKAAVSSPMPRGTRSDRIPSLFTSSSILRMSPNSPISLTLSVMLSRLQQTTKASGRLLRILLTADGRDDCNAIGPCLSHQKSIVFVNTTDGDDRQRNLLNDLSQEVKPGGRTGILFGECGIDRAKTDIVRSFQKTPPGLFCI